MRLIDVVRAWGKILAGYQPFLSIEVTRECPLRCPGCYAYEQNHLGGNVTLRQLSDKRGPALVGGIRLHLLDQFLYDGSTDRLVREGLEVGAPVDQLALQPLHLAELVKLFNKQSERQLSGEQLMTWLLRSRKQGLLPS